VIEDNDDARDGLVSLLELWGHEALGASDGEEGLRVLEHQRPDIALVDLGLPRVDGYEVARRVRGMTSGKRVHLIAVTGYGGPVERERARRAGFDEHLMKPVDTDRLARLIATHRSRSATALMG
jgi:CheY-like chemotaxis protein